MLPYQKESLREIKDIPSYIDKGIIIDDMFLSKTSLIKLHIHVLHCVRKVLKKMNKMLWISVQIRNHPLLSMFMYICHWTVIKPKQCSLILDHHKDIQHAASSKTCRVFEFLIDFLLNHLYSTDITNIGFLIKSLNLNADVSNYVIDY
jgi:hypothetical protein